MRYDKSKIECYNFHKIRHQVQEFCSNVDEKVNLVDNNKDDDESMLLLTLKEEDRDD